MWSNVTNLLDQASIVFDRIAGNNQYGNLRAFCAASVFDSGQKWYQNDGQLKNSNESSHIIQNDTKMANCTDSNDTMSIS